MRHISVLTIAVITLLGGGVTLPSYADPAAPALPLVADDQAAEQVLEHAQAVLDGESDGEATLALVALQQALPDLEGEDRDAALALMARPDGSSPTFSGEPRYGTRGKALCGEHVCIHYMTSGSHRVRTADGDGDGRPDWVEKNLKVMETSWSTEVGALAFRAPRKDGTRGDMPGQPASHGKVDVYLAQLQTGLFGYAQPESDPSTSTDGVARTNTAHMVLDADFEGFSCTPIVCLRATAAHEFFHVIQFAYDTGDQVWFMESTATWMEERVYDSANDNRNYLDASSLKKPQQPLDTQNGAAEYGNWVFHEFYTQRLGARVVRQAWYHASKPRVDGAAALEAALEANDSSLPKVFARFGVFGNVPAAGWSEGAAYDPAPSTAGYLTPFSNSASLKHLASKNWRFTPKDATPGAQLQLTATSSNSAATACALVVGTNGSVTVVPLTIGVPRTVAFSVTEVSRVYVNVANASPSGDNKQVMLAARVVVP